MATQLERHRAAVSGVGETEATGTDVLISLNFDL